MRMVLFVVAYRPIYVIYTYTMRNSIIFVKIVVCAPKNKNIF